MKINTLLFGAGPGAGYFIDNTRDERDFVGILDNDTKKVGNVIFDLNVYSPKSLSDIDYDEIVITTQWAMAVKSQLIEEFGVSETKIVLPVKNQLKTELPFYCDNSLKLGRRIIKGLSSLAVAANLPLVIDFGTLLGIVRDQDIIAWDDDIDFAAPQDKAAEIESLVVNFVEENPEINWCMEKVTDGKGLTTSILLKFKSDSEDLLIFTTSISFRGEQDGKSIHLPSMGMWYAPKHHFKSFTVLEWQGENIQVPADYQAYLTFQYGDWETPKKDIKLTDYAHLQEVSFADIKAEKRTLQTISKE
ncbi:nucleoside-diphosphate sugar epimerase/dehydratase [Aliiglaciecola lipolytica]|uniref:nucleoside-diphosphate sugar epimerase/dehydratase n=1 Tax=Aliiglaciecola lipolytica TaxID=477689 RepID=UPI001C07EF33|nr:LicD family protein [Aliiglaciecola lipolytica]MBU2878000.1 LicD family protein [Aliiglaciecola lipolytica]